MPTKTEAYLNLAFLGKNRWWRYLVGIVVIVLVSMGLMLLFAFLATLLKSVGIISPLVADNIVAITLGKRSDASVLAFFVLNLSIIGMLVGLALTMRFLHRRPLLSLITPRSSIDWPRIIQAAAVGFVILAILTLAEHLIFPGRYRYTFDAARFFPFMIAVLILTPIQAATEELLFRGYLMQGVGVVTRRLWLIAIISTLAFGAVHLANPEIERYGLMWMLPNYLLSGLMFATIALRDGRLELAIGLHAINNIFSALIANSDGSVLQTSSIFTSPLDPVYSLASLIVTMLAFHWWFFDRSGARAAVPGT